MEERSHARGDKHHEPDVSSEASGDAQQAREVSHLVPLDPVNAVHKAALRSAAEHAMRACSGVDGVLAYLAANHRLHVDRNVAFDAMCEVGERELGSVLASHDVDGETSVDGS